MVDAPSPNSVARFVRWAIILFFAYALWHSSFAPQRPSGPPSGAHPQQSAAKEKGCEKNPLQDFSGLALPMVPEILPSLGIEDIKAGTGTPAQCGQTAKLRYEYDARDGTVLYKSTAPENILIGSGELLRGAELGLIGMKTGGERGIIMSPVLAFAPNAHFTASAGDNGQLKSSAPHIKAQPITAQLSLLELSPNAPTSPMPLRMIDTRYGSGARAECSDTVTTDITVWKLDGTKLFSTLDSKPVTFTIGKSEQIPFGIEQGIIGMMEGSQRTLVMPAALTKSLRPCLKEHICATTPIPAQFPSDEVVLVEIARLPAVKESAPAPVKK